MVMDVDWVEMVGWVPKEWQSKGVWIIQIRTKSISIRDSLRCVRVSTFQVSSIMHDTVVIES